MRDYDIYYLAMGANIKEKIEPVIEMLHTGAFDTVLDFGCADGQVIRALHKLFPSVKYIGYDNNREVISANTRVNSEPNIEYTYRLDSSKYIHRKTIVIFSSIFHEMFTFLTPVSIRANLEAIKGAGCVYIRDMYYMGAQVITSPSMVYLGDMRKFELFAKDKEEITAQDATEYLLKRRYDVNFKDELLENYFSTDWGYLKAFFAEFDFYIVYDHKYMNPFLLSEEPKLKLFTRTTHRKMVFIR